MATKKEDTAAAAVEVKDPMERIPYKLPRQPGLDEVVYVSVNDYSCTFKRGEKVMIPRFVAEELDRSEAAKEAFDNKRDQLIEQAESKSGL